MKMKLLDYTLICLLAGVAPIASAQEEAAPQAGAAPTPRDPASNVDCSGDACASAQGELLMRVRTRGEREPTTPANASTSQALQPDRRVTVEKEKPGKAVAIGNP